MLREIDWGWMDEARMLIRTELEGGEIPRRLLKNIEADKLAEDIAGILCDAYNEAREIIEDSSEDCDDDEEVGA